MTCAGIVRNPMLAHRIRHHVKPLSGSDQRVNKRELVIRMHVVVVRSVNDQQTTVQLFRERN